MNRRERRLRTRKMRRIGVVVASLVMLGATAGLTSTAGAAKQGHDSSNQQNNCGKFDNTFTTFNDNATQGNNTQTSHTCTN